MGPDQIELVNTPLSAFNLPYSSCRCQKNDGDSDVLEAPFQSQWLELSSEPYHFDRPQRLLCFYARRAKTARTRFLPWGLPRSNNERQRLARQPSASATGATAHQHYFPWTVCADAGSVPPPTSTLNAVRTRNHGSSILVFLSLARTQSLPWIRIESSLYPHCPDDRRQRIPEALSWCAMRSPACRCPDANRRPL